MSIATFPLPWPLDVLSKHIVNPMPVFGLAVLLDLKAPETREAILLVAIPSGFFGILFGWDFNE